MGTYEYSNGCFYGLLVAAACVVRGPPGTGGALRTRPPGTLCFFMLHGGAHQFSYTNPNPNPKPRPQRWAPLQAPPAPAVAGKQPGGNAADDNEHHETGSDEQSSVNRATLRGEGQY